MYISGVLGGQTKPSDPLVLELDMVRAAMWILRFESRSSESSASVLKRMGKALWNTALILVFKRERQGDLYVFKTRLFRPYLKPNKTTKYLGWKDPLAS